MLLLLLYGTQGGTVVIATHDQQQCAKGCRAAQQYCAHPIAIPESLFNECYCHG